MRRLIAISAVSALVLASVGGSSVAAAGKPAAAGKSAASGKSVLARSQALRLTVTRTAIQGGRVRVTATIRHCDRSTLNALAVVASGDLAPNGVSLARAGTVRNPGSSSRSCVWRGSLAVARDLAVGPHEVVVTVSSAGSGDAPAAAAVTKSASVTVLDDGLPDPTPTPTPTPDPTPAPSADPTPTPDPTPAPSADPSPAPSTDPSPVG